MPNLPNPESRREYFLRKIADPTAPCPAPATREEQYLEGIAENAQNVLPDATSASAGDVLSLDENKAPAWTTPTSSGGGMLILDETNLTLVTLNDIDATVVYYDGSKEVILDGYVAVYNGDISDLLSKSILVDDNCVRHAFQ